MVKIANYAALLFSIAMLALVISPSVTGIAFADDEEGSYSHSHLTASWDHGVVCGDHKCAPGEMPQHPKPVEPVRAH
jgi:hypothetical protein